MISTGVLPAIVLLAITDARAESSACPWPTEIGSVSADEEAKSITVDGKEWPVKAADARDALIDVLVACGRARAVSALYQGDLERTTAVLREPLTQKPCPFPQGGTGASATMRTVTAGDAELRVVGAEARSEFVGVLEACGDADAVVPFERWRRARRYINIDVGIVVGVAGVPFYAVRAHHDREEMIRELAD
jgi:hypothetical protein